jgi:hypothetical protein
MSAAAVGLVVQASVAPADRKESKPSFPHVHQKVLFLPNVFFPSSCSDLKSFVPLLYKYYLPIHVNTIIYNEKSSKSMKVFSFNQLFSVTGNINNLQHMVQFTQNFRCTALGQR